jgi:hypothetical protein
MIELVHFYISFETFEFILLSANIASTRSVSLIVSIILGFSMLAFVLFLLLASHLTIIKSKLVGRFWPSSIEIFRLCLSFHCRGEELIIKTFHEREKPLRISKGKIVLMIVNYWRKVEKIFSFYRLPVSRPTRIAFKLPFQFLLIFIEHHNKEKNKLPEVRKTFLTLQERRNFPYSSIRRHLNFALMCHSKNCFVWKPQIFLNLCGEVKGSTSRIIIKGMWKSFAAKRYKKNDEKWYKRFKFSFLNHKRDAIFMLDGGRNEALGGEKIFSSLTDDLNLEKKNSTKNNFH